MTVTLNGNPVRKLTLRVGESGPWVADLELTGAPNISGAVTLAVGGATLTGAIVAQQASSFGLSYGARVVGGRGSWGNALTRKSYHNDAGIKASLIAQDAANEIGETLGSFTPGRERLGVDFVRPIATASHVLEHAAGGASWWVDYDGMTHVGQRPTVAIASNAYALLDYDERNQVALLGVDDLAALRVGGELTDTRLGGGRIVRDLEVTTDNNSPLRATAWCGQPAGEARLPSLVRRLVEHVTKRQLLGLYRYRVSAMRGDKRVDLQAIRADLPDVRAIAQWPGAPGMSATLAIGAEVLVAFVDGDPEQPVLASYVGPGGPGFAPTQLVLGGPDGPPVARQGDPVEVLLPPAQFAGTIGGVGATGLVTFLAPKADGTIVGGSGRVRAAT